MVETERRRRRDNSSLNTRRRCLGCSPSRSIAVITAHRHHHQRPIQHHQMSDEMIDPRTTFAVTQKFSVRSKRSGRRPQRRLLRLLKNKKTGKSWAVSRSLLLSAPVLDTIRVISKRIAEREREEDERMSRTSLDRSQDGYKYLCTTYDQIPCASVLDLHDGEG